MQGSCLDVSDEEPSDMVPRPAGWGYIGLMVLQYIGNITGWEYERVDRVHSRT